MKHLRVVAALLLLSSMIYLAGQAQQSINITVNQSLFLNCAGSTTINYSLSQTDIEAGQPFTIGTWSCNVDALTNYRLNSTLATTTTNITNADPTDFSTTCTSASGGQAGANAPSCGANTALSGSDPSTRRGTGGNTASTTGADLSGSIKLNVSDWDVGTLPGSYTGTITYSVTDTTP